ncbi:MAG: mechanosensitive ion channel [Flavobacteriales bacterium]|nr:mechanosensitive ion channel [Flavobacteriales bacterium]
MSGTDPGPRTLDLIASPGGERLEAWVNDLIGGQLETDSWTHEAILFAGALLIGLTLWWVGRILMVRIVYPLVQRSRTQLDDELIRHRFFRKLAVLIPILFLQRITPPILHRHPDLQVVMAKALSVVLILTLYMTFLAFMRAIRSHLSEQEKFRDKPIASYTQLTKIITGIITGVIIISLVFERNPIYIFSAMGAASAVLLLVFKDSILGFMASVQLSVNDMVHVGDWVQLDKYGADGEVTDITLTTVKVRNWDKTFTTVPTYAFISDAVKNWRGMQESEGRRIKRAIFVKISSIRFCSEEDLERFRRLRLVKEYVERTQAELIAYNETRQVDRSLPVNGRNQTNVGVFRAYAEAYLREEPRVHEGMTLMVRQLEPGRNGLPLEIYCFSRAKEWTAYERLAADIFDHLLAAAPWFDLEISEDPTGSDMRTGFQRQ